MAALDAEDAHLTGARSVEDGFGGAHFATAVAATISVRNHRG
jgi:hypothetical protein